MMNKELMDKILDGRDIMNDIKSFVLPDMMKIITLNYKKIEIDYDTMSIITYNTDDEISEIWDLTMVIGVQFYTNKNTDQPIMNVIRNKILPT